MRYEGPESYRPVAAGGATGREPCETGTDHRAICTRGGIGCYLRHNPILDATERVQRAHDHAEAMTRIGRAHGTFEDLALVHRPLASPPEAT